MTYGVLPALSVGGVVGEGGHDPGVDLGQGHPPAGAGLDGHGDQSDVGVGRLLAPAGAPHDEGGVEGRDGVVRMEGQTFSLQPRRHSLAPSQAKSPSHLSSVFCSFHSGLNSLFTHFGFFLGEIFEETEIINTFTNFTFRSVDNI